MKRHPNTNIHPGIILKEDIIKPAGLTMSQVAGLLHVSRLTISRIANGRSSITPSMAIRISKVFGGSANLWLKMQTGYDLIKAEEEFSSNPIDLERFEMV